MAHTDSTEALLVLKDFLQRGERQPCRRTREAAKQAADNLWREVKGSINPDSSPEPTKE